MRRRRRNRPRDRSLDRYPPVEIINNIVSRKIRYLNTDTANATVYTITPRCLMFSCGMTYRNTTLVAQSIADAVRIKYIKIWYCPSVSFGTTADSDVKFNWLGTHAPEKIYVDRGNIDRPAYLFMKPPANVLAKWWFNSQDSDLDTPLFNMTLPTLALVELHLNYTLCEGPFILDVAVSDAGADVMGWPALDCSTVAGAVGTLKLIPDGLYYLTVTDPTPMSKSKISKHDVEILEKMRKLLPYLADH